jgi:hypothetical protein
LSKRSVAASLVLAASVACGPPPAASGTGAGELQTSSRVNRDRSLITREELADPSVRAQSVLDVVKSLRPHFLTTRGKNSHSDDEAGKVHVSVDGGRIIPLEELGNMHVNSVLDIRFLDPSQAMQKFGGAAREGPVILVRTIGK